MLKKLNNLSFVIGLFFILIAILLLVDFVIGPGYLVNLYSGMAFSIFGLFMLFLKSED